MSGIFHVGSGDLNSGLYACRESVLTPEPPANSYIFSSFYKVIDFSFICFYYYVKSALSNTQEKS